MNDRGLEKLRKYAMWNEILGGVTYQMKGSTYKSGAPCSSGCTGCGSPGGDCSGSCGCSTSCAG